MIDVVTATRLSEGAFWESSALGLSLGRLMRESRLTAFPAYENKRGLPEIFNERLAAPDCGEYVLFVHDDVWLDDYFLADRLIEGLERFDVIGVAGNRRRQPGQGAWGFVDRNMKWDQAEYLSGIVAHGKGPFGLLSNWGAVPAECELMDGVFLAAKRDKLRQNDVTFDAQFDFHLYDIDFCRTARKRGLKLGTWPICITHQGKGQFATPHWFAMYDKYIAKWGD